MQISIYLKEDLVKKVNTLAKRENRSRSKVIEALLEFSLKGAGKGSRVASLLGAWKDSRSAKEIIDDIYKDRERNRRSERVAL